MKAKEGKRGVFVAKVVVLILAGFALFNIARFITQEKLETAEEKKVFVEVTEASMINLKWLLEQTGDIHPQAAIDVYPRIPGKIIEKLLVEKGDYLKRGGVIALLEDDTIRAKISEAKAALKSAKAKFKQIEVLLDMIAKDRKRLESLFGRKVIGRQKLDHIESEHEATKEGKILAQSQIERAEAVLKQLEILFRNHKIYAPASGCVSDRYLDQGAMSRMENPIIRISCEEKVKIITTVTEKDFPFIKKGMKAEIRVDAYPDKIFSGTVSIINPTIDPVSRTGEIEIHIPNKDLLLRSGMYARIKILLGEKLSLVITRDALNKLPGTGNYYVYVVENGRAALKNVETGIKQGNLVEIISGIEKGERIVIKGQNQLKNGSAVIVDGRERGTI